MLNVKPKVKKIENSFIILFMTVLVSYSFVFRFFTLLFLI